MRYLGAPGWTREIVRRASQRWFFLKIGSESIERHAPPQTPTCPWVPEQDKIDTFLVDGHALTVHRVEATLYPQYLLLHLFESSHVHDFADGVILYSIIPLPILPPVSRSRRKHGTRRCSCTGSGRRGTTLSWIPTSSRRFRFRYLLLCHILGVTIFFFASSISFTFCFISFSLAFCCWRSLSPSC